MSIFIDKEKCKKCGKCAAVCPGSLIGKNPDGTACMRYPKDCWGCSSCIKECKFRGDRLIPWRRHWRHGK